MNGDTGNPPPGDNNPPRIIDTARDSHFESLFKSVYDSLGATSFKTMIIVITFMMIMPLVIISANGQSRASFRNLYYFVSGWFSGKQVETENRIAGLSEALTPDLLHLQFINSELSHAEATLSSLESTKGIIESGQMEEKWVKIATNPGEPPESLIIRMFYNDELVSEVMARNSHENMNKKLVVVIYGLDFENVFMGKDPRYKTILKSANNLPLTEIFRGDIEITDSSEFVINAAFLFTRDGKRPEDYNSIMSSIYDDIPLGFKQNMIHEIRNYIEKQKLHITNYIPDLQKQPDVIKSQIARKIEDHAPDYVADVYLLISKTIFLLALYAVLVSGLGILRRQIALLNQTHETRLKFLFYRGIDLTAADAVRAHEKEAEARAAAGAKDQDFELGIFDRLLRVFRPGA